MTAELVVDTHTIVRASGEIDLSNADSFGQTLNMAVQNAPGGLVLDLSDVTYMDSAGVQVLLHAYRKLQKSEGILSLAVGNELIKTVLGVARLELLPGLCIRDDLDSARQCLYLAPADQPILDNTE